MKFLFLSILALSVVRLAACPMCLKGRTLEVSAQPLVYAARSVIAQPADDGQSFTVVAVIKGDSKVGDVITEHVFRAEPANVRASKTPLLLIRDDMWSWWANFGTVTTGQAELLKTFAATKRTTEMNDTEQAAHAAAFLPYLNHPEPLISAIAVQELSASPQAALIALKPKLDTISLRKSLADSKGTETAALYSKLLEIAEDGKDGAP